MADLMQAIRYHEYGGPEVLRLEQVERPSPDVDQVLVRVKAAGVNPADWKMRAGLFKAFRQVNLPLVPGLEGAGTAESLGPGVTLFQRGQPVYGLFRSYAEYALAYAGDLQPIPGNLSYEQAASIPIGALTAWGAVIEAADIQAGQRVVVHGAAGGVGVYCLQLARWRGANVTGTASDGNQDLVRSLGADQAINYRAVNFEDVLQGVDAVIDTVGGDIPERSLKIIKPDGVFVTVAGMVDPDMGRERNVRVIRAGRAGPDKLAQINELIEAGKIHPVAGHVFPLSEARQAHELSQTGHGRGRIILKVNGQ